jgi:hypothetical protein
MTSRSDFTDDEWRLLTELPRLAALGAVVAQDGDLVSTGRELMAGLMEMARSAQTTYPRDSLIQDVLRGHASEDDIIESLVEEQRDAFEARPGAHIIERALSDAGRVHDILAARATPAEAEHYASWVIGIARAGVEAAKTGRFGVSGARVTEREAEFEQELARALGASSTTLDRTSFTA